MVFYPSLPLTKTLSEIFCRLKPCRFHLSSKNQPHRRITTHSFPKEAALIERPKRIILIRHGESEGNVNDSAYTTTPDWRVPLTDLGREQASNVGKDLHRLVGNGEMLSFYCSPYKRTRDTVAEIRKPFNPKQIMSIREEPRISEQQFGNFQNVNNIRQAKRQRHEFGRFYYRFKDGEAGLDVYSRVSSFIATLMREWQHYQKVGCDLNNVNVVVVTHGLCLRLFLMRWYQMGVEDFEATENPNNAQMIVMTKRCDPRFYHLNQQDMKHLNIRAECVKPWPSEFT